MPQHQIWQMLQCAHILSMSIHFHTRNMYCRTVLTVLVSILLTNKKIKDMKKQQPQLGFTFITLSGEDSCLHMEQMFLSFNESLP